MRVLAEIRWCETHGREEGWPNCPEKGSKETCVVVDAQVTRTTAGSTPRPYKQPCPDCDGTGYVGPEPGTHGMSADCPSCSVEPKQTEQNKGQHDDHPEGNIERAADIIRRNTARTSDLISIGGGAYGIAEWDTLDPKEQDAWMSLARKAIEA